MTRIPYERRILLLGLAAGLPGTALGLTLLWTGDYSARLQWTLTVLVGCVWLGIATALEGQVVRPLQTLSNLLEALREGDYSFRARGWRRTDSLGEVMREANALADALREQRLGAVEATALLQKVMGEIDVAIFAFDGGERLRLLNRAGERLLAQPAERLLGATARELGIEDFLRGEIIQTVQINLPGAAGRWELRRSTFREGGLPHQLVVLSDLTRALREEERSTWQRLVRVLGHEVNNSLAPIKSIAGSLESLLEREPRPADWQDDMQSGLRVVASRAEALTRFLEGYTRLAKLPPPRLQALDIADCIRRVAGLETRLPVDIQAGPAITLHADRDQLEQLLINLVRNAVDAALETHGGVSVRWKLNGSSVEVLVEDEGPGVSSTANLFVPFFTTKPGGSGIGLVLSRQIAEAHGGTLSLENRARARGCLARLRLPVRVG
ncbi:MAG: PAS domain-containing sensor histidine kinase [Acidobacteriia bacterium]|nr:PAS domain-containing sensor histidine kinase [Terriglobia bacterium]